MDWILTIKKILRDTGGQDLIELYTKENCSFCDNAKTYLRNLNTPFVEYKLNEDFTREILKSKYPSATTYPVVVIDGFYIGGYTELREHHNNNDSRKFLSEGTNG